jgi:hypothetical protein
MREPDSNEKGAPHTEYFKMYRRPLRAVGTSMQTPALRYPSLEGRLTQCVKGALPGLGTGSAAES